VGQDESSRRSRRIGPKKGAHITGERTTATAGNAYLKKKEKMEESLNTRVNVLGQERLKGGKKGCSAKDKNGESWRNGCGRRGSTQSEKGSLLRSLLQNEEREHPTSEKLKGGGQNRHRCHSFVSSEG